MKHSAIETMKFKRLKRRLDIPLWKAVGLLESLWQCTIASAPCGDIGKYTNDDIAAWMEYNGDADDLVEALVESGWIDRCSVYRLVIHDWADHAPNFVKGNYKSKFVVSQGTVPRDGPLGVSQGATLEDQPLRTVPPNVTKPNENISIAAQSHPKSPIRGSIKTETFDAFWSVVHRKVGKQSSLKAFFKAVSRVQQQQDVPFGQAAKYITERMEAFTASPRARDEVKGQIHPSTWLNEGRYDDDPEEWEINANDAPPLGPRIMTSAEMEEENERHRKEHGL